MDLTVFQMLVRRWVVRAFGEAVADDRAERTHRFLEEALELAQATDCTQDQAHALVEYVYGRERGSPGQEVGGTLLTLAALCAARDISINVEAAAEISRVNKPEMLEKIRHKQEAKKRDIPLSPLPQAPTRSPDGRSMFCTSCQELRHTYRAIEGDCAGAGSICCGHCQRVLIDARTSPPQRSKKPDRRTYTDAVGTDGGKATVSKPI